MYVLLLASWLCLPTFPLNPIRQDTIAPLNLHFTIGVSGPDGLVATGPETTTKFEMLMMHPFVVRTAFGYRFGKVNSKLHPMGYLHGMTASVEALYYRGTHKLTGYIGVGIVHTLHHYQLARAAADSLYANYRIDDVSMQRAFGYRIILGLRLHRIFSIEIGITEVKPKLAYTSHLSKDSYSITKEKIRLSDVCVTVGYLLTLKRL